MPHYERDRSNDVANRPLLAILLVILVGIGFLFLLSQTTAANNEIQDSINDYNEISSSYSTP